MKTAQTGSRVKVHYTMKLSGGEVVGTSKGGQPLVFTIGKGNVVKGLENGVIGMQANESRTIEVTPEEGFGIRNEKLIITIEKKELPAHAQIEPGKTIQYKSETGENVNFVIIHAGDKTVTLDGNHPFAGQTLTFEVVLVAIA